MSRKPDTMRLAVFASGGGSNFQAILDHVDRGVLDVEVALCVSNRPDAYALTRAEIAGVPTLVIDPRSFDDEKAYVSELLDELAKHRVNFIALAGYLRKIPAYVVAAFRNRIVNIHPSLLPAYGGKGLYGRRVHEAVLAGGEAETGATVHVVNEEYDKGPVILQERVQVVRGDTAETLSARVLNVEHALYSRALGLLAEGRVHIDGDSIYIKPVGSP